MPTYEVTVAIWIDEDDEDSARNTVAVALATPATGSYDILDVREDTND